MKNEEFNIGDILFNQRFNTVCIIIEISDLYHTRYCQNNVVIPYTHYELLNYFCKVDRNDNRFKLLYGKYFI